MNCPSCAAPCPDGSKFCPHCGYSLPREKRSTAEEDYRWETAQIKCITLKFGSNRTFGFFGSPDTYQFVAKALGPNGEYNAEVSDPFKGRSTFRFENDPDEGEEAKRAHQLLVDELLRNGWDHTGQAKWNQWFSTTFRRRVSK